MSKESRRITDLSVGRAQAKYVRVTPMKARRVTNLVRGKMAEDAVNTLKFAPQAASRPVRKEIGRAHV